MMKKLLYFWGLLVLVSCSLDQVNPPSVLIIMADDQGWGDLSYNGNLTIATPNIDEIAKEGLVFDNFYVSPVCSPTRAEVLTGRYHFRSGIYGTSAGGERLNLGESTIAETFQEAGYATALFGKWHSGSQGPYHPNQRGFEEFFGFCSGHWGHYFNPLLEHNGVLTREEGYVSDILTNQTMEFIDKQGEKPFFIWLAFNTPHSPMQVPDQYWEGLAVDSMKQMEETQDTLHTKAALAMVKNLDDNVGRIMQLLKDKQLEENTIVVYMTDNGPNGYRYNGGMKGIKGSTEEGGTRSPFFIQWKNHLKHQLLSVNGAAIDLFPTLAQLAGLEPKTEYPLDGKDLLNASQELDSRMLVQHWNGRVGIRSGDYRLSNDGSIYHISQDRGQRYPLEIGSNNILFQKIVEFRDSIVNTVEWPSKNQDHRPFPVGTQNTFFPARDAILMGNLTRSNPYPNSSYITNWTSTLDSIKWNSEVLEKGKYELLLHYTCKEEAQNSRLKVQMGGQTISVTLSEVHDPPAYGRESDRTPRIESYVKDFKRWPIGVVDLEVGDMPIVITAEDGWVPGGIELAMLEFKRIKL
ncbi:MAG: arylsulfatase [Saprospiraceae bacterium]